MCGVTERQRFLRRWLVGYVAILFGTLPIALPCWNGFLRDSIGRFVTIEQIHLAQYAGLGWFAARYARADARPWRTVGVLLALLAAVGLADELVQGVLPQRFFGWSDIGLNVAGGMLGMMLAVAVDWMVQGARTLGALRGSGK